MLHCGDAIGQDTTDNLGRDLPPYTPLIFALRLELSKLDIALCGRQEMLLLWSMLRLEALSTVVKREGARCRDLRKRPRLSRPYDRTGDSSEGSMWQRYRYEADDGRKYSRISSIVLLADTGLIEMTAEASPAISRASDRSRRLASALGLHQEATEPANESGRIRAARTAR